MSSYFIESFKITKLWGYHDINLSFSNDVNILIGPNASGKTTILNSLHSILSLDLLSLLNVNFAQAEIKLGEFEGKSVQTVKVDFADRVLKLSLGEKEHEIDIDEMEDLFGRRLAHLPLSPERGNVVRKMSPRQLVRGRIVPEELYDELTALVPIVWLPVSRLPIPEEEAERYTRTDLVESVDVRLDELLDELSHYHSRLNTQLSERYKKFEHQVLLEMLYNKEHDQLDSLSFSLPTQAEKDQLLGAFEAAELLDEQMRIRIDEHFAAAEKVSKRIGENPTVLEGEDALVLSLIGRTKAMVEYAGELEKDRERIFAPLRLYEETVNSFLNEKSVEVDADGKLKIQSSSSLAVNRPHHLRWRDKPLLWKGKRLLWQRNAFVPSLLSSGEKQILILLTQALLRVDEPVVYIADEPELSLHVLWQEKLLKSLVSISGQIQVIVATHSPDIVGGFMDKIIDLGRKS